MRVLFLFRVLKGDKVIVLDTEDFTFEEVEGRDYRRYARNYGVVGDITKWVRRDEEGVVLLWRCGGRYPDFKLEYMVGIEGEGMLLSGERNLGEIVMLRLEGGELLARSTMNGFEKRFTIAREVGKCGLNK